MTATHYDDDEPLPSREEDYPDYIDRLILRLTKNPGGWTPDMIAERLFPGHILNQKAINVAGVCRITKPQMDAAMRRVAKKLEQEMKKAAAEAQQAVIQAGLHERFNLDPTMPITERTVTAGFLKPYTMNYGRTFIDEHGQEQDIEQMLIDLQLTAADYDLTRTVGGSTGLSDRNLARALSAEMETRRKARLQEVWAQIEKLTPDRTLADVHRKTRRMVQRYFKNSPELAEACIRKVIWQCKRKMCNLPIGRHHAVILFSAQDGGKTYFWSLLRDAIWDLTKQVDVVELISESQLDIYTYVLIDLDEMAKAERADMNKFKTLITKGKVTKRVFYTQLVKDVTMMATMVGSSNLPLSMVLNDPTGMRRFIQLDVKGRDAEMEKNFWKEVAGRVSLDDHAPVEDGMDWLGLWQSVDHLGPDPLEEFRDDVAQMQEKTRQKTRVEVWLDYFEVKACPKFLPESSDPPKLYQWQAIALFRGYQIFEEQFLSGKNKPMTLANWSTAFKLAIEQDKAPEWSYSENASGNRCFFTYQPNNVVALGLPAPKKTKAA